MKFWINTLLLSFLFTVYSILQISAQEFSRPVYEISLKVHYGFIADVGNRNHLLIKSHIIPFEISFSKTLNLNYSWQKWLPVTKKGVSIKIINLQNPEYLGNLVSVMPFFKTGVFNSKFYSLNLSGSLGILYAGKIYQRIENYRNTFFSTHLNAAFGFGLENSILLADPIYFKAGIDFMHFSNGEIKQPNDGMNIGSVYGGLSYSFKNISFINPKFNSKINPEWKLEIVPVLGWKTNRYNPDRKYLTASFSCNYIYTLTRLQNIGIGASVFYDKSVRGIIVENQYPEINSESFRSVTFGMHLIHDINLYPLTIVLQFGYFMANDNVPDRSLFYNRLGIKYFLNQKLFLNLTHKSHFFFKGDTLEWGLGFMI